MPKESEKPANEQRRAKPPELESKKPKTSAGAQLPPKESSSPTKKKSRAGWVTVGTIVFVAFLYGVTATDTFTSSTSQGTSEPLLEATFYDAGTIPFFVGRTAESSAVLMRDRFDEQFDTIRNADTDKEILTYFRDDGDLNDLEGLFVCSQSMAPGADVPEYAFRYINIEVSKNCGNKKVSFAMGAAAKEIGQFVPLPFDKVCYTSDASECDVPQMDGVVIGFPQEGFSAHKSVLVETGMGVLEVELALIDLSDDWCDATDSESKAIRERAIQERNSLLSVGSFVRLIRTDGLYGNERFVHHISSAGTFPSGKPPSFSVNELLVSSGYWIPDDDAGNHDWESLYSFSKGLKNAVWQPSTSSGDDKSFTAYQKRILKAANLAFAKPNPILATCLQSKESQVLAIYSEEDKKRRSAYSGVKKESEYWAIWRSVFCPDGGAEQYPQRCKNYTSEVGEGTGMESGGGWESGEGSNSDSGSSSSGGSVSGGGSKCTWVNGYKRNGSYVRAHWRCG